MAEDVLLKHQDLVDELKQYLGNAKFDLIFKSKTAGLSKPEQFLIKMEMSRLSQPIERFIDLRGLVTGQVKPYNYKGKQHFMDDTAVEVFEAAIKKHKGYTIAVYEAVMNTENNHRVLQQKLVDKKSEPNELQKMPTNVIKFASYESRREERMNYSIKITIDFEGYNKIAASTSDISLSGGKIKLASRYIIKKGQLITMHLVGLEQDFELGLKNGIEYEVVAIENTSDEFNHLRLKRTFSENNPTFDRFLESFIHGNKRRYKVNLDNTLDAVISKGYEQYYIPRVNSLFAFISEKNGTYYPNLSLTTENNMYVQRYFTDESKTPCLYSILNSKRIRGMILKPVAVKEEYLYTFTHTTAGKVFYYSATRAELDKQPHLKDLFFSFGSQRDSWRCFKLQLMPSHHEDAYIPLSLPDSLGKKVDKLNKPPSPRVTGMIKDVKYLMLITDVGNKHEQQQYQKYELNKALINQLKLFGHAKQESPPALTATPLEYVNLRANERYLYKTDVVITTSNVVLHGYTRDFSIFGLQIECNQEVDFKKGDKVTLTFPELQKITKSHSLSHLKYEVMAVSKSLTTINLKAFVEQDASHTGVDFFTLLIKSNKQKLKVAEESTKIPGLSTALRNMITKSLCQFPIYLQKELAHFNISAIGLGLYPSPLHVILQSFAMLDNKTDLSSIITKAHIINVITPNIKNLTRQDPPLEFTLVINFDPKKDNIADAITSQCVLGSDCSQFEQQIGQGIKSELVFVMRLYISRTGRLDTDYLANELKYVSQYAMHKAKDLEDALWSVAGVGDIVDVSDEALAHLALNQQQVEQMSRRKLIWLNRLR